MFRFTLFVSVAGHETSAGTIKYTLHALSKDQERQDKLRAELSAAGFCATFDAEGKEPTYDELMGSKTLPYLDAVVKEAYATSLLRIDSESLSLMLNHPWTTPVHGASDVDYGCSSRQRPWSVL